MTNGCDSCVPNGPSCFPLALYRGDSYRAQFRVWQDCDKTIPYDLNYGVGKAEIRDRPGGQIVVPLSCTISMVNHVDIVLLAADSQRLPSSGQWDLQITFYSGDVLTIVAGPVTTTPDVTDSAPVLVTLVPAGAPVPTSVALPCSGGF